MLYNYVRASEYIKEDGNDIWEIKDEVITEDLQEAKEAFEMFCKKYPKLDITHAIEDGRGGLDLVKEAIRSL